MAFVSREVLWLRRLLSNMSVSFSSPTPLFCDNQSAIHIVLDPVFHQLTTHIEIDCHIVRQYHTTQEITPVSIASVDQPTDLLTKGLTSDRLLNLCSKLGVSSLSHPPACEGILKN